MIKKVGIVGFGQMGSGIGQVAAGKGYEVIAREVTDELFQKGISYITRSLDKAIEKGKIDPKTKDDVLSRIKGTTALKDLADCDIVCEAVIENLDVKQEVYRELDTICKPETIFASNTSSLSISEMAAVTK